MIEFSLKWGQVGTIQHGVPEPPLMVINPGGGHITLEEIFFNASDQEISLIGDTRAFDMPFAAQYGSVDEMVLQESLVQLTRNPNGGPVRNLGLLFSNTYSPKRGIFGFMFDAAFEGSLYGDFGGAPREGCAVFLDAIGPQRSGSDFSEYLDQVAFTSVHELAHVFNLHHVDDRACFLNTSQQNQRPKDSAYRFLEFQRQWLARCGSDGAVQPGGSSFSDPGIDGRFDKERHFRSVDEKRWRLEIEMSQPEFWAFEPVELEISLHLSCEAAREAPVPDEMHPGYESFSIWIEEPGGERRRYRPTTHFCGSPEVLKIAPGGSITKDISIFGQSGGYTFRRAGLHRIWVTFDMAPGRRLTSKKIDATVLPFTARTKAALSEKTAQRNLLERASRTLFYRSAKLRPLEVANLEKLARDYPSSANAATAHYAVGCAAGARVITRRLRNPEVLKELAKKHLSEAAGSEALAPHRREKAENRLKILEQH